MTRREERDKQVLLARSYQIAIMRLMQKLEEQLIAGVFTEDIHKVMRNFKLLINDALHDVAIASLITREEEESLALLESEAAEYEANNIRQKSKPLAHVDMSKRRYRPGTEN